MKFVNLANIFQILEIERIDFQKMWEMYPGQLIDIARGLARELRAPYKITTPRALFEKSPPPERKALSFRIKWRQV